MSSVTRARAPRTKCAFDHCHACHVVWSAAPGAGPTTMDERRVTALKRARNARTYSRIVRQHCRDGQLRRGLGWQDPPRAESLDALHAFQRPKPRLHLIQGGLAD